MFIQKFTPHIITFDEVKQFNPIGIILSGGPMSVYDDDAPDLDEEYLKMNIPILVFVTGFN